MAARKPPGGGPSERRSAPRSRPGGRLSRAATAAVVAAALAGAALAVATLGGSGTDPADSLTGDLPPAPATLASPAAMIRPDGGEAVSGGTRVAWTLTPSGGPGTRLTLTFTDAASGAPVDTPSPPVVWADRQRTSAAPGAPSVQTCEEKARTFASGRLGISPDVDLNAYYVLTLNDDATISVIDPHADVGGMTQLLAMPTLSAPGEDWTLSGDRLFVTLPEAGRVAVIDTASFDVIAEIEAGPNPVTVDAAGETLWVTNDAGPDRPGAITVIDAVALRRLATVPVAPEPLRVAFVADETVADETVADETGAPAEPHHEHAATAPEAETVVIGHRNGTVTTLDAASREPLREVGLGVPLTDLATVPGTGLVYVALAGDQPVTALDEETLAVESRLDGIRNVTTLAAAPDDHLLFALGREQGAVAVIDAHAGAVLADGPIGIRADQISFTDGHAHVRSGAEPRIAVIDLARPGEIGALDAVLVPLGQGVPAAEVADAAADALVAVHGREMLVAHAADQYVYMYMPGMNAPMGGFQNYGRTPRAVTVVDRGLARSGPGTYVATLTAPGPGSYDLMVALAEPSVLHCFTFAADSTAASGAGPIPVSVEPVDRSGPLSAGTPGALRFRLLDAEGRLLPGLTDVAVLATSDSGRNDSRSVASPQPDGSYLAELTLPEPGGYTVRVSVPSLAVGISDLAPLQVEVR